MVLYIQNLTQEQVHQLEGLVQHPEAGLPVHRVRIVLLSARGKGVLEISRTVQLHPVNVRKWLHRFATHGVAGLRSSKSPGRPLRFSAEQRNTMLRVAQAHPQTLGLPFARWSLHRLRRYLMDQAMVDEISVETIRHILQSGQA
jgi:transposase